MPKKILLAALLLASPAARAAPEDEPVLQVPEGFVVEKVAMPPIVDRPIMAGFDEQGRLYVGDSSGVNIRFEELLKAPPHRILRLEDTHGDGVFDKSLVFAEGLTFPMGSLWHRGSLYVCAPPSVWKLTPGPDGKVEKREEIVTKFGSNGNAADIHGPFLHPSGRIYWSDGRHGHQIRTSDGTTLSGQAARIFRAKPDGSAIEVVCGGGMDNPVEVAFTEDGEGLATVAILHSQPRRIDSIIHCIWGGVFPYADVVKEFKRTGDLLPSMVDVGWVAPSGLMRYRGRAFGKEYTDNFFSAQFNVHKVQRHIVERDGATFRARNEDFLVSTHPDFHPTDVLEDADGSLLVIDTGGWFRIGCPTSRVDKPQVRGGIYRVRRKNAPKVQDPRGLNLPLDTSLAAMLDDDRFAVRDRAIDEGARRGAAYVQEALKSPSARARRNAVWALARIDGPEARAASRPSLADPDPGVRMAAASSAGLHRDPECVPRLLKILRDDLPHLAREAATALGRIGDKAAVADLFLALKEGRDRFLEHSLIYALIEIHDRDGTLPFLGSESPIARRAALIALDQMDGGSLAREQVTPCLDPSNPALQKTALEILAARGWSKEILNLLQDWLGESKPRPEMAGILTGFAKDTSVQDLAASALRRKELSSEMRIAVLEAMAQAPLDRFPATWSAEIRWSLDHPDPRVVRQAVATLRAGGVTDFDDTLLGIAKDDQRRTELRVEAFAAAAARVAKLDSTIFTFVFECLKPEAPVLLRVSASQGLGAAGLSDAQLGTLSQALPAAGALELPKLLGAYERSTNGKTGQRLVEALSKAAALESLQAEALRRTLKGYPEDVRTSAEPLLKKLEVDTEQMKARLAELEPALHGGDAAKGREVFQGQRAACTACHAVNGQGARVGPDLSKIGSIRQPKDLLEAVVFPSASFARGYEPWRVRSKDGAVYDGLIVRETADAITLMQADRTEKRIPRASVEAIVQGKTSIMPQGFDTLLPRDDLRDMIAYLFSLK
jgi:putative membrane-bound dehydrogenase-like protein